MTKKSQITVYILLALILAIGYGLIVYLRNSETEKVEIGKISNMPFEISPIKTYIENCIENTGKNALLLIGKQGGYYKLKNPYLKDDNFNLPYYIYNYIDFSPSIKDIENEISKYIDNRLESCINNFEEFKKIGFDISQDKPKSNTKIAINSAYIEVNFPIVITKGGNIQKIEKLSSSINNVHLKSIHNVSKEISNLQYQEPNKLCLSCLYDFGEKNNLYIDVIEYPNNTLIFEIRDYNNSIAEIYNFTFAIRYPEISCKNLAGVDDFIFLNECLAAELEKLSNPIKILDIDDFNVKINETFSYDVNANGKNFLFEDFTDLVGNEDLKDFEINITK